MIDVSRLCEGEALGPDRGAPGAHPSPRPPAELGPVVIWNVTRRCNLRCLHCPWDSANRPYPGELTTAEAWRVIDDLAAFRVPGVVLSGGEPLMRADLLELAAYAQHAGLPVTLATTGTLIDRRTALRLRAVGCAYVGISLDGLGPVNDRLRGVEGAFERARAGLRHCLDAGQKVGLRFTLTRSTAGQLDAIFDFVEAEGIQRVSFSHPAHARGGRVLVRDDLSLAETRRALDTILARTQDFLGRGLPKEILTMNNPADRVYFSLRLRPGDPARAARALALPERNGDETDGSGAGIGNIDWLGDVHPHRFRQDVTLGNVRERPFSEIWRECSHPILAGLEERVRRLTGRCAGCRWLRCCGGGFRARAVQVFGDPWAADPACYLTDEEIGLKEERV